MATVTPAAATFCFLLNLRMAAPLSEWVFRVESVGFASVLPAGPLEGATMCPADLRFAQRPGSSGLLLQTVTDVAGGGEGFRGLFATTLPLGQVLAPIPRCPVSCGSQ